MTQKIKAINSATGEELPAVGALVDRLIRPPEQPYDTKRTPSAELHLVKRCDHGYGNPCPVEGCTAGSVTVLAPDWVVFDGSDARLITVADIVDALEAGQG